MAASKDPGGMRTPANKLILSRSELTELVYGKLHVITAEAEEIDRDEFKATTERLADMKTRLKRIALEARRAAALIETHEHLAKAGHCTHCGKTYAEHFDAPLGYDHLPGQVEARVRAKGSEPPPPRCKALQRYFESLELETYQPIELVEAT